MIPTGRNTALALRYSFLDSGTSTFSCAAAVVQSSKKTIRVIVFFIIGFSLVLLSAVLRQSHQFLFVWPVVLRFQRTLALLHFCRFFDKGVLKYMYFQDFLNA